MEPTIGKLLFDYFRKIIDCTTEFLTKEILIEKIKQTETIAEGLTALEMFYSLQTFTRFMFYDDDQKLIEIKRRLEALQYFDIFPPSPPEAIAHLFVIKQSESIIPKDESFFDYLKKLEKTFNGGARLNPEKFKKRCLCCKKEYCANTIHELMTCPFCGESAKD